MSSLSLAPFDGSRIALKVTNLLGDVKGEYWTDSISAALDKAHAVAQYPDTVVWLYDTTFEGVLFNQPNARIGKTDASPFSPVFTSL